MSTSAVEDIRVGSILRDTYEIVSLLGTGGMGKVYLARHLRLPSKQVAVKVLLSDEEVTADQYERFRREAEITSRLGHPNIVGVLDFHGRESEGHAPFLVLEYLHGESLSRRIKRGPIPLPEVLFIARQMGSALHAAHQAGVIHRDLKPGNVFLVPTESWDVANYQVKLLDFGISKLVSSQTMRTQDDVLMGTPRYMSPEQARGQNSKVDARSDLFALAVIVYEMLSGRSPFADDSVVGIIYRIVNEPVEPLASLNPDLPASVIAAVEKALSKQPADRQPGISAFIEELTGVPGPTAPSLTPGVSTPPVERLSMGPSAASVAAQPATVAERGPASKGPRSTASSVAEAPAAATPPAAALPPPPDAASPPRSRTPLFVGAGLALLGVLAGAAFFLSRTPPAPTVTTAPAPVTPPPEPAPTQPAGPPPPETAQATPSQDAPTPSSPPARSSPRAAPRAEVPEAIPALVKEDLEAAERALTAHQSDEAIRLLLRSQRTQKTGTALVLLTRAYCQKKDLGNARAQWNALPKSQRAALQRYCEQQGVDLTL